MARPWGVNSSVRPPHVAMTDASETAQQQAASALAQLDLLIDWERKDRGAMRVFIEPARDLCRRLGDPQRTWQAVHVAGSKGKGSTSSLIAAGLRAAGLCVGRYGSPHVERMHERIVLDGQDIDDERLAEALQGALAARQAAIAEQTPGANATWFDVVTAAAFRAFAMANVDWAVIEVGLGGRLDSTNIITPQVCVITTIELEHAKILGGTLAAIAGEKAGILKSGCALVTGVPAGTEPGRVIDARAAALGIQPYRPQAERFARQGIEARHVELAGAVLDCLGARGVRARDGDSLTRALLTPPVVASARLPARLERFSISGVPVVLDGAHTPASVRAVLEDLRDEFQGLGRPQVVLGTARDKDLEGMLKGLAGQVDRLICTSVGSDLHRTPEEIRSAAESAGLAAETAATPRSAIQAAIDRAHSQNGWVLAIGSLYLAGSLRPLLRSLPKERSC